MAREIKFRAQSLTGELTYFDLHESQMSGDSDVFYVRGSPCKVGTEEQFTGLKDKNDKEIYEGDIIQFLDKGNMFDSALLLCTAQVTMKYARWFPKPINVKGLRYFEFEGYGENENCYIVGNIYENPELLEG